MQNRTGAAVERGDSVAVGVAGLLCGEGTRPTAAAAVVVKASSGARRLARYGGNADGARGVLLRTPPFLLGTPPRMYLYVLVKAN